MISRDSSEAAVPRTMRTNDWISGCSSGCSLCIGAIRLSSPFAVHVPGLQGLQRAGTTPGVADRLDPAPPGCHGPFPLACLGPAPGGAGPGSFLLGCLRLTSIHQVFQKTRLLPDQALLVVEDEPGNVRKAGLEDAETFLEEGQGQLPVAGLQHLADPRHQTLASPGAARPAPGHPAPA